ncbi:MAG: succinate dehydrogenase cytochrome b subunit [Acidimicrobiia bacterium]
MSATQLDLSSAPTPVVNGPVRHSRWYAVEFYRSAVGKKWVMAISGLFLLLFVLFHMLGNAKALLGADDLNHYGEWLRNLLVPFAPRTWILWGIRGLLMIAFALHMMSAYQLTKMNHRARPQRYVSQRDMVAANWASRTMRYTGIIVILYLVFHLADLTWGTANGSFVRGDPFNNMVNSFRRPAIAGLYQTANMALGIHMFHGAYSFLQTLGWNRPRFNRWRVWVARLFALGVAGANLGFPAAVQVRIIDFDYAERVKVCQETNNNGVPCQKAAAIVAAEAEEDDR